MEIDDISLGQFLRYKEVKECKIISMDNIKDVQERSWLNEKQILYIQKYYKELSGKYERFSKEEKNNANN